MGAVSEVTGQGFNKLVAEAAVIWRDQSAWQFLLCCGVVKQDWPVVSGCGFATGLGACRGWRIWQCHITRCRQPWFGKPVVQYACTVLEFGNDACRRIVPLSTITIAAPRGIIWGSKAVSNASRSCVLLHVQISTQILCCVSGSWSVRRESTIQSADSDATTADRSVLASLSEDAST